MIKFLFTSLFDILSTMFVLHVFVEWGAQDQEELMAKDCWPVELTSVMQSSENKRLRKEMTEHIV